MCGIVGFTSPDTNKEVILSNMLAVIRHRGPDAEGVYFDSHLALGHARLAIIDINGGVQPRIDNDGQGAALIYNGEIYGYKEIADTLRAECVPLKDHSDTEVLFWLLKMKGLHATLKQMDGMFAFVYRTEDSNAVYLVRDRFGEKPLFYGIRNGQLVFASEILAILQHPLFLNSSLDKTAIGQYLTLEYIPGEKTGFDGIYKVLPGHIVKFDNGILSKECYWCPILDRGMVSTSTNERLNQLEILLSESVKQRLIADVPVGVFLSGGLDSSLIAAIAARETSNLSTFTIKMPQASFDESAFAKITSTYLGVKHDVLEVSDLDLQNAFDAFSERIDQPFADSSFIPTYLVCQSARRSVTVALGGDGADELFAGYPNFKIARFAKFMEALPPAAGRLVRQILKFAPASSGYMNYIFLLRQLSYGFGHPSLHQPFHWMSAFSIQEQSVLWRPEEIPVTSTAELYQIFKQLAEACGSDVQLNKLLFLFTTTYLPDDILMKVDRASMYNSLEVRSPYLGHAFSDYVLSLSGDDKLHGFETKMLLKKTSVTLFARGNYTSQKTWFCTADIKLNARCF